MKMTKFDLAEASLMMSKAVTEMSKAAAILQDSECFENTVAEIKSQIGDMTIAVELINSELREVV